MTGGNILFFSMDSLDTESRKTSHIYGVPFPGFRDREGCIKQVFLLKDMDIHVPKYH